MLFEDYAREIRTFGECYLVVSDAAVRIVASRLVCVGPDGMVIAGTPLPESASLYRLFRPHPRWANLAEAKPAATDAALERWFVADLIGAGAES